MMFQGAYDSEFYRHVRDLLHEQAIVQQWKVVGQTDRHRTAAHALDARWDALIATEAVHRTGAAQITLRPRTSCHV
jgi:anaerobic magnesium-protoporphyrin IX monomethyl ester cyclase